MSTARPIFSGSASAPHGGPIGYLADRLDEIPRDAALVVHCRSGVRSMIAASVRQAAGFRNVVNLTGGYLDWQASGHPTERDAE